MGDKSLPYEYCVYVWGGFFNQKRSIKSGCHFFNSKREADDFKESLSDEHGELVFQEWEGHDARIPVILHRTLRVGGFEVTTHCNGGVIRKLENAIYYLENKWYPGFNDEPFGEDFDYSQVEVVKEWITGPFPTWVKTEDDSDE